MLLMIAADLTDLSLLDAESSLEKSLFGFMPLVLPVPRVVLTPEY